MKQFVTDKTERIEMGKIIELRGNFIEHETEDGISYECDYYRTTDKNATFESLYQKDMEDKAKAYLSATNYISNNYNDMLKIDQKSAEAYLKSVSDTFRVTVEDVLKKRVELVKTLNSKGD